MGGIPHCEGMSVFGTHVPDLVLGAFPQGEGLSVFGTHGPACQGLSQGSLFVGSSGCTGARARAGADDSAGVGAIAIIEPDVVVQNI